MRTHHSYLPFYYNSQEKQFLKGILGRKSHCINGAFVRKKSAAKNRYLFLQKASS